MKKTDGFTILEVMVSMVVISLVSISFSQVMGFVMKSHNRSDLLNQASHWGQMIIEDFRNPVTEGIVDFQGSYNLTLARIDRDLIHHTSNHALIKVTITIKEGENPIYSLSTMMLEVR